MHAAFSNYNIACIDQRDRDFVPLTCILIIQNAHWIIDDCVIELTR
jgi:hypothetical protein